MRKLIVLLTLILSVITASASGGSDFDRMKTLAGEWDATGPEGKLRITFQVISNGTAVMETMGSGGENMVTIYHRDGESTLMTHYCSAGNQPRMRAQASKGGDSLTFQFVDVANLKTADAGHMRKMVIKFQDADHVIEEWTWKDGGKEMSSTFHLSRVK